MRGRGFFNPDGVGVTVPGARMDIVTRADGRIERVCKHGVGHPIGHISKWETWMFVHGCDGCCSKWEELP